MIVNTWTGVEVRALREQALRRTQPEFAEMTGFSEAVVRNWERRGATISLAGQFAAGMDTLLRRLDDEQTARFRAALCIGPSVAVGADRSAAAVEARVSDLRRALDAHDVPDDGPIRSVGLLRDAVAAAVDDRLNSNYIRLACELPGLLGELHRARLVDQGIEVDCLLVQAYRAADAIADKYGYHDLSARIITMMQATAARTGDELLGAATTYVRTESFFASGQLATGRKLLERTADAIDPSRSISAAATYGSLHMRAAVVAAKEYRPDAARAHLDEAANIAVGVPEGVYFGTAFGPASVRIHQVSLGVEMGDAGAALAAARDWAPSGQVPAERRSHFYIDVARAHMLASQRDNVLAALHEAQSIAPQHTGSHPLVKELLAIL